ncbi:MFS transporter [Alphaproteobacteria bacterium]|nr:MFS transporter [Alphaproteobacteria bacterium]
MIKQCFKNIDFRILWGAGCMTGIARAMEFLALSLYALQELGIPYLVTIIFAARMLPMSLLGIVIGTISERISPVLVIKFIYTLSNVSTCIAIFLVFTNNFNVFFAFLLAFINGITWVVDLAVRRRVLADNIDKNLLSTALAMETLSNNATRLIGPLCAGSLYTFVGLDGIFSVQLFMYILALSFIIKFQISKIQNVKSSKKKFDTLIKQHWAHGLLTEILKTGKNAYNLASLRLVLIITLIFNIFGFPLVSLIPVLGKEKLALSEFNIGVLASSEGFGALIGALIIGNISPQKQLASIFIVGITGFFIGMVMFSLSPSLLLAFISLTFGGIFLSGFSTMQGALVYQASETSKGSNFGILVTCIGTAPIGLMNLSWIITHIPVDRTIQINVGLGLFFIILTLFYNFYRKANY